MKTALKTLILSTATLLALTLSAVAEPPAKEQGQIEQGATQITETLEVRQQPRQPLVVQEDVADQELEVEKGQERPRGRSRTDQPGAGSLEKPLLEVHGF